MKSDLTKDDEREVPRFFYHLGDVVYYNGQVNDYYDQFYEPYDHYDAPIIAIPGNHDGDPVAGQTSLDGWVRYFMSKIPHIDTAICGDAPRVTLSLPNVYFTLNCPFVTIVGLYTNVPEGGSIDSVQQQWLTNEFFSAPEDKALILALHHPIYSFDDHHSGSPAMADAVQHAINDSRRVPNLVLTAHVHNYQRIERKILDNVPTPFLVAGAGGYYHLHGMTADTGHVDHDLGATLKAHDQYHHSYVTLTVDADKISGVMTPIAETGSTKHKNDAVPDTFSYTAKFLKLADDTVVSL
jgi:acid phosphatase type 7